MKWIVTLGLLAALLVTLLLERPEPAPAPDAAPASRTSSKNDAGKQSDPEAFSTRIRGGSQPGSTVHSSVGELTQEAERTAAGTQPGSTGAAFSSPTKSPLSRTYFRLAKPEGRPINMKSALLAIRSVAGDGDRINERVVPIQEGSSGIALANGKYEAHAYVQSGMAGVSQRFAVSGSDVTVELPYPVDLEASLTVFDSYDGRPLSDAIVRIESTAAPDMPAAESLSAPNGIATLPGVPAGPVRLTISKTGYGEQVRAFPFPCKWNRFAIEGKPYDLGGFDLHRERIIGFELTGAERWDSSVVPFQISQGDSGPRTSFNDQGLADLPVVLDTIPLVIKVFYPDGFDSVRYLRSEEHTSELQSLE